MLTAELTQESLRWGLEEVFGDERETHKRRSRGGPDPEGPSTRCEGLAESGMRDWQTLES